MTDNVIPFKETPAKCNFCGTPETDAKHFFSSGTGKHNWEPLELVSYNRNRYRYKCTRCGNIITTLLKEQK